MKILIIVLAIMMSCPLQSARAEGPRINSRKLSKDIKWFDIAILEASRKYPIQITIKTPDKTTVVKGMFLNLAFRAGKETRKDGVISLSQDALVEVSRSKPSNDKTINLSALNRISSKGQRFQAKWISVHWFKITP